MSNTDYALFLARREPRPEAVLSGPDQREEELHAQIRAECRKHGWYLFGTRMDKKSTMTRGAPDFVVVDSKGVFWCIEAKTRTGKLSVHQRAAAAHLRKLGVTVHVVRSLAEFIEVVK